MAARRGVRACLQSVAGVAAAHVHAHAASFHAHLSSPPLHTHAHEYAGGAGPMLTQLIDSFTQSPAALLGACPSLPLLLGVRSTVASALATAVKVRAGRCVRMVVVCACCC